MEHIEQTALDKINEAKDNTTHSYVNDMASFAVDGVADWLVGKLGQKILKGATDAGKATKKVTSGKKKVPEKFTEQVIDKSNKATDVLEDAMTENKTVAKALANKTIAPEDALRTVLKNSKLEAEVGPNFAEDVTRILRSKANMSDEDITKAVEKWVQSNKFSDDLTLLLEAKDPVVTKNHSEKTAHLARELVLEMGGGEKMANEVYEAARLHDIGKVAVPDRILSSSENFYKTDNKKARARMADHDRHGGEILKDTNPYAAKLAEGHHGRGEKGADVDALTISDRFEAMTTKDRPYKKPLSVDTSLKKLKKDFEDYLPYVKELEKKGILNNLPEFPSELKEPFEARKKNYLTSALNDWYKVKYSKINNNVSKTINTAVGVRVADDFINDVVASALKVVAEYDGENDKKLIKTANGTYAPMSVSPQFILKTIGDVMEVPAVAKTAKVIGNVLGVVPSVSDVGKRLIPTLANRDILMDEIYTWANNNKLSPELEELVNNTNFKKDGDIIKLWSAINKVAKDDPSWKKMVSKNRQVSTVEKLWNKD